ncbi:MAG: pyruvate, phosphate dikinase [Bacteroidales bacterium]|nr:pyruvate, phosphate dikinase [Bacteroidales bacterium]MCF8333406.1 pyruvate, phosphate dikinase [Bacteroidales bacterium]
MNQNKDTNHIEELIAENRERTKELATINKTTNILSEGKSIDETLSKICRIIPPGWQYPQYTVARIRYGGKEFRTRDFEITEWSQKERFVTIDNKVGSIEVYYTKQFVTLDEGPFLKEERDLIKNLAEMICGYINSLKAKELYSFKEQSQPIPRSVQEGKKKITNRQLLRRFLNKSNYNRDIYHDLMPFKVKEILLFANLYDAFTIEREGRFSEHVLGEYHQLNLTSMPRITGVSSEEELEHEMSIKHFDLIIFMVGLDVKTPVDMARKVKNAYPYIPIHALLNNNSNIGMVEKELGNEGVIDKIFAWNGESKVFFSMIKNVEDKINVENDTQVGLVRVILLVEDSPKYYSRYLPILYKILMEQTRRIIEDVSTDELYKVLRMRARPKILHATDYEEAMRIYRKYKEYMLCLISDVKFKKDDTVKDEAGFELVRKIRDMDGSLPIVIQSSNPENSKHAYQYRASFINKSSETLEQDLRSFINYHLGFGNFIYRNKEGKQIATAKSLKEFEQRLRTIPDDSLIYHGKKNHFSLWLMARGEIQAARILSPHNVSDFDSADEIRSYMLDVISKFRNEQNKGKIIPFEESAILDPSNIIRLADGALGGKGRGLAFINTLINNFDFSKQLPDINISFPKTSIIGTEEFEYFMNRNGLYEYILEETDHEYIKEVFLKSRLTDRLIKRLKALLRKIDKPLAVRSSGLFEDSLTQPFAGIFDTFILPNNHKNFRVRLQQLCDAIKLVYASVYSKTARSYIHAIDYKIEEEKMAVVIQEVVGNQYDNYYYPHISGVAQSYNYYPISHMQPDDGFVVAAIGLGKHVVEGEKAYRFCPKYPDAEINSTKDLVKNSQTHFWALDLSKDEFDLKQGDEASLARLDLDMAEKHGVLKHTASVYDLATETLHPGVSKYGPRIINFADILKYRYIPLAKTLEVVLDVVEEAMGSPVEIEFAVDLNRDKDWKASFYLLQIKPLIGKMQHYKIDLDEIPKEKRLLYSERIMGNGVVEGITDVVFIDRGRFDKSKTPEMAEEIDQINEKMKKENRKYVLIGPGRWGTRDRWIGIPVNWPQISNAKVIVETGLKGFPLDASSGSHFFHNVTSMNVGYFSILSDNSNCYIDWKKLESLEVFEQLYYFKHVRLEEPLGIKMDGRNRFAIIHF